MLALSILDSEISICRIGHNKEFGVLRCFTSSRPCFKAGSSTPRCPGKLRGPEDCWSLSPGATAFSSQALAEAQLTASAWISSHGGELGRCGRAEHKSEHLQFVLIS